MKYLLLLVALLISGCVKHLEVRDEYKGQDAGRIVIGIGAAADTNYHVYTFLFRRIGTNNQGRVVYLQNNMFAPHERDYDTKEENGVVWSFNMQPGNYEIYNFSIHLNGGNTQTDFYSRRNFSIPFTIRPNETTYVGNYQANMVSMKGPFGVAVPNGAIFVVTDRERRDLELVRKRIPDVVFGPVSNSTPTPETIGNPLFVGPKEKPVQNTVQTAEISKGEVAVAIRAFEEVCLKTAPSFSGAAQVAANFGIVDLTDAGFMKMGFNKDQSLGVQIKSNNECVITTPSQRDNTLTRQLLQVVSQHAAAPPSNRVPTKVIVKGVPFIFQHDRDGGEAFVMLKAND